MSERSEPEEGGGFPSNYGSYEVPSEASPGGLGGFPPEKKVDTQARTKRRHDNH
jgi:hypothetical protein